MHFNKVNKGILPLIFIVGLFKITGIESVENGKSKENTNKDYDYDNEMAPSAEVNAPNSGGKSSMTPYFENKTNIVYFTHEGENITLNCAPKRFDDMNHTILWYRDAEVITNGNTTLVAGNFEVGNKYSLTISNYTTDTKGKFSCSVHPGDVRQDMIIQLRAPDNISERSGATLTVNINNYWTILGAMAMLLFKSATSMLY